MSACGPKRPYGRFAKQSVVVCCPASQQAVPGAGSHWGGRHCVSDCPAVLAQRSHRGTRCVRCARYAQTAAMRMSTKRAARADRWAVLLGAPQIARAGYRLPRRCVVGARALGLRHPEHQEPGCKGLRAGRAARLWGAEEHRACGLARSAIRAHSRRSCPSAAPAGRVASSATGRKTAHRRAVGAFSARPLQ